MGIAPPRVAELKNRPIMLSFGRMIAYAQALGVPVDVIASQNQRSAGSFDR